METWSALAYLVAAVLFILALRGLSHPTTSRRGNKMGIIGMAIAIVATLSHGGMSFGGVGLIVLAVGRAHFASFAGPAFELGLAHQPFHSLVVGRMAATP